MMCHRKAFMRSVIIGAILAGILASGNPARAATKISKVIVVAGPSRNKNAILHWKITNDSKLAVYVYDFYLLGPAYHVQKDAENVILDTTPVKEEPSCPPNRFPPVLLLVGPGRTIEGDLVDSSIGDLQDKLISIRVAVGPDPYTVVAEAKRFYTSGGCRHNPYDAIVRWGTILKSNAFRTSSGVSSGSTVNQNTPEMRMFLRLDSIRVRATARKTGAIIPVRKQSGRGSGVLALLLTPQQLTNLVAISEPSRTQARC
jgi:hypothetical protein